MVAWSTGAPAKNCSNSVRATRARSADWSLGSPPRWVLLASQPSRKLPKHIDQAENSPEKHLVVPASPLCSFREGHKPGQGGTVLTGVAFSGASYVEHCLARAAPETGAESINIQTRSERIARSATAPSRPDQVVISPYLNGLID